MLIFDINFKKRSIIIIIIRINKYVCMCVSIYICVYVHFHSLKLFITKRAFLIVNISLSSNSTIVRRSDRPPSPKKDRMHLATLATRCAAA